MREDRSTIGLVIPNFNGGRFLGEALASAIAQDPPLDEILVVDGGSRDSSLSIAKRFAPPASVVSEPDRGQADAIRKGFGLISSTLVGWLNSDDRLLPGTTERILGAAEQRPDGVLYHGDLELVDVHGRLVGAVKAEDLSHERMRSGRGRVTQPGSFYRADAVRAIGGVDPTYHLLMDVDLWVRLLRVGPSVRLPGPIAQFRVHGGAKSSGSPTDYYRESLRLVCAHERDRLPAALVRRCGAIAVHWASWHLGLRRDRVRKVAPPAQPPRVFFRGGAGATARKVLAEEGFLLAAEAPESADLEVASAELRGHGATPWGRPVVVECPPGSLGVEPGALLSFVLADPPGREALVRAGFPPFRIGRRDVLADWREAIACACGKAPGGGGG